MIWRKSTAKKPRFAFNLWQGIEKYQRGFEPLVGHQVIWDDVL